MLQKYFPCKLWEQKQVLFCLQSGNNIERCNASEVFLDVYPLEKPGSGRVEESEFLSKQHSEMADLLTDRCHVVRIIAIKVLADKWRLESWILVNDKFYYLGKVLYEEFGEVKTRMLIFVQKYRILINH